MNRTLSIAVVVVCLAGATPAHSAGSRMNWGDGNEVTCMEPFAPSVPKPDETTLEKMLDEVQPEVRGFIENAQKYLGCVEIKINKAREERDEAKIRKLVKQYNDSVDYQKQVADEYNAVLNELKRRAGLLPPTSEDPPAGGVQEGAKPADGEKPQEGAQPKESKPSGE